MSISPAAAESSTGLDFGKYLLQQKEITESQLRQAASTHTLFNQKLGETLCSLGYITRDTLNQRFAEFSPDLDVITKDALQEYELDRQFMRTHSATSPTIRVVHAHSSKPPLILIVEPNLAVKALRMRYQDSKVCYAKLSLITDLLLDGLTANAESMLLKLIKQSHSVSAAATVSPVNFVDNLTSYALCRRASDIHLEPEGEYTRIRLRIDGVLHPIAAILTTFMPKVCSVLREKCNNPAAEDINSPADGKYKHTMSFVTIDVRMSMIPSIKARGSLSVVLRLLAHSNDIPPLSALGLEKSQINSWQGWLNNYSGVLIVSGPTGSGKSTTIYSAISEMISPEVNLIAVEDPVERFLDGAKQVQVSKKISFAQALKSFMRHDPDIIVVGEIRDAESATAAFHASLTGHLVVSTIHASSSLGIIPRLIEFDIDNVLLVECLKGLVSQRLVRKNCPFCKSSREIPDLYKSLFSDIAKEVYGQGCPKCLSTGYSGRTTIAEVIPAREFDARMLVDPLRHTELRKELKSKGVLSIVDHAALKVSSGLTTASEVFRVL